METAYHLEHVRILREVCLGCPPVAPCLRLRPLNTKGVPPVRAIGRNSGDADYAALVSPHAGIGGGVQLLALLLGHPAG